MIGIGIGVGIGRARFAGINFSTTQWQLITPITWESITTTWNI